NTLINSNFTTDKNKGLVSKPLQKTSYIFSLSLPIKYSLVFPNQTEYESFNSSINSNFTADKNWGFGNQTPTED
ncbi:hypothetical protein AFK68_10355, partial [Hydrocoleum sp. CS-953]|uniref:hypothetical protein n=1 Tax=Hydrocoleum sp. CS-953 TaxID=1671698 RepID=UPI000BD51D24